jgi:hypothetical protein
MAVNTSAHSGIVGTGVGGLAVPPKTDPPNVAAPKIGKTTCAKAMPENKIAAIIVNNRSNLKVTS